MHTQTGRFGHVAAGYKRQLIVFGGSNNKGYCDDTIYKLDVAPPPVLVEEEIEVTPEQQMKVSKTGSISHPFYSKILTLLCTGYRHHLAWLD